jgi:hypothetical protein
LSQGQVAIPLAGTRQTLRALAIARGIWPSPVIFAAVYVAAAFAFWYMDAAPDGTHLASASDTIMVKG